MTTRTRFLASWAAAAALFAAAPASADGYDTGLKAAPIALYDWSGAYFGGHIGYGWGTAELTENLLGIPVPGVPGSLDEDIEVDGFLAGVHVGMNKQLGKLVVGAEIGLSGSEIDGDSGNNCFGIGTLTAGLLQAECDASLNWMITALAKVGYAHNRVMVYGTLGWAVAGIDYNSDLSLLGIINLPSGTQDTADGFAYGLGAEYAATDSVRFALEYLRADLEAEGDGLLLGGIVTSGERDLDLDRVTARINFSLN